MKKRFLLPAVGILLSGLLSGPGPAAASTELFDDTVSSCTTANCSSIRLPGTLMSYPPSAGNWVANVFALPGECLRLDVSAQTADLEMVVVAPNGTVYRNDDRSATNDRPLVKIASAPRDGWYTVHLAHYNGDAVNADFILLYGRYPGGNPNCSGGTPPLSATAFSAQEEDLKPGDRGATPPPPPGFPGAR